ncbi:MAG TPA: phenylalanine--tRNA ligase subunit alpha, partial [Methanomicrobiales archaeon]|nr:phenylalanine--tRNA ligase subunit alpha [Methanomicrobiales archaeon]
MDLTANERRLLGALGTKGRSGIPALAGELGTSEEAALQYARLLAERGLAELLKDSRKIYTLTDEGKEYQEKGLPERQLLESFAGTIPMKELQRNPNAKLGIGWMRKKGWVAIRDGVVAKAGDAPRGPDEAALGSPSPEGEGARMLAARGLLTEREEISFEVALTKAGRDALAEGPGAAGEVGTLTREQITTGSWKGLRLRRYSLETHPKPVIPGKLHPYQRLMNEMREILLDMGFTELYGGIVQSAFWNFDALFQPQDHPAREMQDTFYLDECEGLPGGYERVKAVHENGGGTGSTGWGGKWSAQKAEQCVLRTHTTLLSIQHLAKNPKPPVKAFCIGRVYRREAIDPTHLPEFEQLEGIVMDEGVNFTHLLGYLTEFYHRMGFPGVRFRPGYFPYTEP